MTQALVAWERAKEKLQPNGVSAQNSLVGLTSSVPQAVRAIEALEAVHEEIPVDVMLASLKRAGMKFSAVKAQEDVVSMFTDGGITAYNATVNSPPPYVPKPSPKPSQPRERQGRCKFHDAGICKFGDNCRWNHIDGGQGDCDMVGPYRQISENEKMMVGGEQAALMASLKMVADVIVKMMPGVSPSVCQVMVIFLTLVMVLQLQPKSTAATSMLATQHLGETLGSIAMMAQRAIRVVVDTAATRPVAGIDSIGVLKNRGPLTTHIVLQTAKGVQRITEKADLTAPEQCMDNSLVVHTCSGTLCAAITACKECDMECHIDRGGVGGS